MKNKSKSLKWLLSYTKPYAFYVIGILIFSVVSVVAMLMTAIQIGDAVDCIVGKGKVDFGLLKHEIFEILIELIVLFVSDWLKNLCTNRLTYLTTRDIRNDVIKKIETVSLSYIDKMPRGDLLSRILTDVTDMSDGLLMGFTQLFSGITMIVATIVFMLTINYKIGLVVIVLTPLSLFVSYFVAKGSYKMFKSQSETRGELTSMIEEMVGSQKVVKAFSMEEDNEQKFASTNAELKKVGTKATFYSAITNPATRFVNNIVYVAVGIIGALMVIKTSGAFTVGLLTSFLIYANKYTKPFNEISGVITELQSAMASAKRVKEVIEEPSEKDEKEEPFDAEGNVKIEGVDFSYNKDVELIKDFNLEVLSGERVAIVGPTGCGKTTVINLLMRFYDVDKGNIKVDEKSIYDMSRNSLRENYGMVLQETWLKTATIKENIRYGRPDATDEEVILAAKEAHAHAFIEKLPNGYDTVVSDETTNISAGQKQLLCIARVMLRLPPMLILDEATSSIDTRTELKIQDAFATLMKGRTSFIVAHRLSTIKNADKILVMKDGNIIEQGKHEELIAQNGFYANLYNSQFDEDD